MLVLKFYNAIARQLGLGHWPASWQAHAFRSAVRGLCVQHFQSIVLHDYLPRIISREIYENVMTFGRQIARPDRRNADWIPIEFAAAIGRFGHSIIRQSYDRWNLHLDGKPVGAQEFIAFSYRNSNDHLEENSYALPGTWITNWFRQFDFTCGRFEHLADPPVYAARLDTRLAPAAVEKTASQLTISVIDGSALSSDDGEPLHLRSREAQALLGHLALSSQ